MLKAAVLFTGLITPTSASASRTSATCFDLGALVFLRSQCFFEHGLKLKRPQTTAHRHTKDNAVEQTESNIITALLVDICIIGVFLKDHLNPLFPCPRACSQHDCGHNPNTHNQPRTIKTTMASPNISSRPEINHPANHYITQLNKRGPASQYTYDQQWYCWRRHYRPARVLDVEARGGRTEPLRASSSKRKIMPLTLLVSEPQWS